MKHVRHVALFVAALAMLAPAAHAGPAASTSMKATVCEMAELLSERTGWLYSVDPAVACSAKIEWHAPDDGLERNVTLLMQTEGLVLVERRSGTIITTRPRELDATIAEVEKACPSKERVPVLTASVQRKEKEGIGWVSLSPSQAERSDPGKCMLEALRAKLDWPYPADGTEVLHFAWRKTKWAAGGIKGAPKKRKGGQGKNIPGLKR